MPQIAIRDIPGQIQQAFAQGWTLQNVGSENVYIDNYPGVSPSTGYVVQPGVALPVSPGAVIWAVCDTGKASTVAIAQGVSAPTVTNLTIDAGVVQATIDGPVEISSGTVNLGAPVQVDNTPDPLANVTSAVVGPGGQTSVFLNLDVSKYSSVFLQITPHTVVSGFPDVTALADFTALWLAPSLANPLVKDEFFASPYSQVTTVLNVKGPLLTLAFTNLAASGTMQFDVVVLGYRSGVLPEWYFNHWISDTVDQGYTAIATNFRTSLIYQLSATITRTTAGTTQAFSVFDHYSGPARIPFQRLNPLASTPAMSANIAMGSPGGILFYNRSSSALLDTVDLDIYLPRAPIYLRFTSAFAAKPSTGQIGLTLEFEGVNKEH